RRLFHRLVAESQDVELDAILGELCALETQFEREINQKGHSRTYNGSVASTTAVALNLGPSTPTAVAVPSSATTATVSVQLWPIEPAFFWPQSL
ncbi:hypothetical protein HPB47_024721, partial [Ixodes persulcatus]